MALDPVPDGLVASDPSTHMQVEVKVHDLYPIGVEHRRTTHFRDDHHHHIIDQWRSVNVGGGFKLFHNLWRSHKIFHIFLLSGMTGGCPMTDHDAFVNHGASGELFGEKLKMLLASCRMSVHIPTLCRPD